MRLREFPGRQRLASEQQDGQLGLRVRKPRALYLARITAHVPRDVRVRVRQHAGDQRLASEQIEHVPEAEDVHRIAGVDVGDRERRVHQDAARGVIDGEHDEVGADGRRREGPRLHLLRGRCRSEQQNDGHE